MSADLVTMAPALEAVLSRLLASTRAMRCTVRIDHPARGLSVNVPCAEVLAPGAASMMNNSAIDHRRAPSLRWVEKTRQILLQDDVFANPVTAPPPALVRAFGTRSQMVAPLIGADDYMFGWVSAHFAEGPRPFTPADIAAIEAARQAVLQIEGMPTGI
jgi:GAF domain-containing protein